MFMLKLTTDKFQFLRQKDYLFMFCGSVMSAERWFISGVKSKKDTYGLAKYSKSRNFMDNILPNH